MSEVFEDAQGRIMFGEYAGGSGGGATSYITRPATDEEKTTFLAARVTQQEAALEAAKVAHTAHLETLPATAEARAAEEKAAVDAMAVAQREAAAKAAAEQAKQEEEARVAAQDHPTMTGA